MRPEGRLSSGFFCVWKGALAQSESQLDFQVRRRSSKKWILVIAPYATVVRNSESFRCET